MSQQFHNQTNKQKNEGEVLYEEIVEVELDKYDPKELSLNKENFILPGNPRITTLIPPKRTLSNNNSTPFIYQNNKFDKEFYNQNIPNYQSNNLLCTCGLLENHFNNKRNYSSKNIRKNNSSFSLENRANINLNTIDTYRDNLSTSNYSMPICTCGLTKNYSFSNFRNPISYKLDKKNNDNKYICNCPCGINRENYQNIIPNNRRPSFESNRSQRQMIISMSTAGEEMNNLAKNINLKRINSSNKINQNKYLKIPNIGYIPHAPSYYFSSNSYVNYSNKTMPKLYPSQDNNINYICPKCQYRLNNKNLNITHKINNSLPLNLYYNFNNAQFSNGYNHQRITTDPNNNQLFINKNKQDNFIENSNEYNIISQKPYINPNINFKNEKMNSFPELNNNENINKVNIMNNLNMNFNEINNNKNLNLNEYNSNEVSNEKLNQNNKLQNKFLEGNNDLANINTDNKQNLNIYNNQYNYNDINEKQNITNNNINDIKENNLNMNYNINVNNNKNKNDNLNDNIKNENINSNEDQKENINYENFSNNENNKNLNYNENNENNENKDNNNLSNKNMNYEPNNEDKNYEEMNNKENNEEINLEKNNELKEDVMNSNENNKEINYEENNQINNINEKNYEIEYKENNIINNDNENNNQNFEINSIEKENLNLNENNFENNDKKININEKENEKIKNYENNMKENDINNNMDEMNSNNYQANFDIYENKEDNKNNEEIDNNKNNNDMNYNANISDSDNKEKENLIQNNKEISSSRNNRQIIDNQSDRKNEKKSFDNKKNKDINNYGTKENIIDSDEKGHLKSNINYENINYDKDDENLKSHESNKSKENNNFNIRQMIYSNEKLKNLDYNSSQSERVNLFGSESSNKKENQNENINKFETLNSINNKENFDSNNINNNEKGDNFEKLKIEENEEKDEEYEDKIKTILQKGDNSKINLNQKKNQKEKVKNIPRKPTDSKNNQTSYLNMAKKITGEKTKNRTNSKKRNYSQKNLKKKNNVDININNNNNIMNKTRENNSISKKDINYEYQIENKPERKLKFNPKKTKSKPLEPLFSKYEQLQGNKNIEFNKTELNYKNQKEIFPSALGIGITSYYKTKINQNKNNRLDTSSSNNTQEKKIKKYDTQSYFSYKTKVLSDNPFEGPSQYEKSQKERKNYIAKAVEKEENEFYDISYLEESIFSKKDLKEDELSQLIIYFINILYKDVDKILNNKDEFKNYNYKINRISNIIIYMKTVDQIKVMESLKRTADSRNKMEIFEKLSKEIDEINKFLKNRGYKFENIHNSKEGYSFRYKNSKILNKSMRSIKNK